MQLVPKTAGQHQRRWQIFQMHLRTTMTTCASCMFSAEGKLPYHSLLLKRKGLVNQFPRFWIFCTKKLKYGYILETCVEYIAICLLSIFNLCMLWVQFGLICDEKMEGSIENIDYHGVSPNSWFRVVPRGVQGSQESHWRPDTLRVCGRKSVSFRP